MMCRMLKRSVYGAGALLSISLGPWGYAASACDTSPLPQPAECLAILSAFEGGLSGHQMAGIDSRSLSGQIGVAAPQQLLRYQRSFSHQISGQLQENLRRTEALWGKSWSAGPGDVDPKPKDNQFATQGGTYLAAVPAKPSSFQRTPFSVWGEGYAAGGETDRNRERGAFATHFGVQGGAAGFDMAFSPEALVGLAFGYADGEIGIPEIHHHADLDIFSLSLYGGFARGGIESEAALFYTHADISSRREINLPILQATARGKTNAWTLASRIAGRYWFDLDGWELAPEAALTYSRLFTDGYEENGAGPGNLRIEDETVHSLQSELGITIRSLILLSETVRLRPEAGLAWSHEWGERSRVAETRFVIGGPGFATEATRSDQNQILTRLTAGLEVGPDWRFETGYIGRYGDAEQSHGGRLAVRWSF